MIFWKSWHEVRGRFLLCLALVTVAVCPTSIFLALEERRGEEPAAQEAIDSSSRRISSLASYAEQWFQGSEFSLTLLAVILAVGGTMTEAHSRSNLVTLSLPRKRRSWLLAQWSTVAVLTMGLVTHSAIIIVGVGLLFGVTVPYDVVALGFITLGFWSVMWIGPAMLSTSLTREPVKAATLIIGILVSVMLLSQTGILGKWGTASSRSGEAWANGVPWRSLLVLIVIGFSSLWWCIRRFEAADY